MACACEFCSQRDRISHPQFVSPSGLQRVPTTAKDHENSGSPTESLLQAQPKKRFTKRGGSKVASLGILAGNAVRNADLHRALDLIEEIRVICEGGVTLGAAFKIVR